MNSFELSSIEALLSQAGENSGYVVELYQKYQIDPALVGSEWANYFDKLTNKLTANSSLNNGNINSELHSSNRTASSSQEIVTQLVEAYRTWGHLQASVNPLRQGIKLLPAAPQIEQLMSQLDKQDLEATFACANFAGNKTAKLSILLSQLQKTYCGNIGFEYKHLSSNSELDWFQSRIESQAAQLSFDNNYKLRFLERLVEAEGLESELHKTYVGAKRFSLQGAEAIMPALDYAIDQASITGVRSVVIGMAHRGRLNVLTHLCGKPYQTLCSEFEDQSLAAVVGAGDVKYHLGHSTVRNAQLGHSIRIELAPNPSHLEFINPVVEGLARAQQDIEFGRNRKAVLPVLIHGDAAFIGQGIVWETLNMSGVDGYRTGGTLHLVINNQVGFTTNPEESRTSIYCADLAKGIQAPIIHVNGEDVEAVCWAVNLALDYRQTFGKDVVVDMYCYRKYGHNEGDDPTFTQPLVYSELQTRKSVATLYAEKLVSEQVTTADKFQTLQKQFTAKFQDARSNKKPQAQGAACAVHGKLKLSPKNTAVNLETLKQVASTLINYPAGFEPHPKLKKILEKRVETLEQGQGIDWGFAEGLAFGSLVSQGVGVRLSGQDAGRGTFSQRHLLLTDANKEGRYLPFEQLATDQAKRFEVYNSVLSEAAVMGFEFGFASIAKNSLVIWEGQFGDFANGAQVIIDQFISSSEAKWNQLSGVTLMLPHGFEGQGPEHSSARLERYLQLCAEGNMTVAYPSNAAQHFHLLRRQALCEIKRPLVIMTPKSLLRLPQAASCLEDLTTGGFSSVLKTDFGKSKQMQVVLCTGKVYYDLVAALEQDKNSEVRVLRLEQLYPLPVEEIKKATADLKIKSVAWLQEEPQNMGAWGYIAAALSEQCNLQTKYFGRASSASPATGSAKRSAAELQEFIAELLGYLNLRSTTKASNA